MDYHAIISAVGLSLLCAACAVALSVGPGMALAYLLARKEFRGKSLVELAVLLPLVLPPVVLGYLLLELLGKRGMVGGVLDSAGVRIAFTWLAAAIAQAVVAAPLMVLAMRVAFEGVDRELELAALSTGASRLRVFLRVTLPLSWHGIAAGCVLALARALGEFGATIIVAGNLPGRTRTLPLAIYTALNQPDGQATANGLVVIAIALALAALAGSRWIGRGAMAWLGARKTTGTGKN